MESEWQKLAEHLRDAAEGYAATDPLNGWQYRQEAAEIIDLKPPATAEELASRRERTRVLRQRWSVRLCRKHG